LSIFEECLIKRLDVKWSITIGANRLNLKNRALLFNGPEVGKMNTSYTAMMDVIAKVAAEEEKAAHYAAHAVKPTPNFAPVPKHPFHDQLEKRISNSEQASTRSQEIARVDFTPVATAVPTSLSIDDASVKVNLFNLGMQKRKSSPRATLVNTPSMVDESLTERRIAQIDQVMRELESTENFWSNAELLLQDSWLNGYRGTFLEQTQNFAAAAESYKRALKLYALALRFDRLTAKSSPHIISYYYLLKRYADVLCDQRLDADLQDARTVHRIHEQMEIIRAERQKWGMNNPEFEDEPFNYPGTILKVLCL